jgi:hypothetical protein
MPGVGRCDGCNAAIPSDAERCDFCGAAQSPAAFGAPARADEGPFARIRRDPQFAAAEAAPPVDAGLDPARRRAPAGCAGVATLIAVVSVATLAFATSRLRSGDEPHAPPFALLAVSLGWIAVAALLWFSVRRRRLRLEATPLRVLPALVVAKRTEVVGSGSSTATRYHVTLEFEDGSRRESHVPGSTFGFVAERDECIAVFRGSDLAGLRVRTSPPPRVDRPRGRA